jgi:ABC-type multidrug transport system ATPase subunit
VGVTVSFSGITKRYGGRTVLRDVSGSAAPGQTLAIVGPNGAGKSTLLGILCGLVRPTRGSVRYRDDDGEIPRARWRSRAGVATPAMSVYRELDGMENLRFFARVRGLSLTDDELAARFRTVGLEPSRRTLVSGYSTGMQQRLKLALAWLHEPDVLLLDEPGANLDVGGRDWLETTVMGLVASGATVVVATNDQREAAWGDEHVELAG